MIVWGGRCGQVQGRAMGARTLAGPAPERRVGAYSRDLRWPSYRRTRIGQLLAQ